MLDNTLGIIVGNMAAFFVLSWFWAALILGITGLFEFTRDSDHRLKIDFKQ